ncbi:hypothetical protein Tco_0259840 [Tanacetum coccineum]
MESVSFPPLPPLIGIIEKQNLNKFCHYHGDRGHNTNDCYHLKKQLEEVTTSGKLAYLVKDIRRGNQRNRSQGRGGNCLSGNTPKQLDRRPHHIGGDDRGLSCSKDLRGWKNIPSLGIGRPHSDHGRTGKEQNCAIKVCHSKVLLTLQCDNGKNMNDKIWSGRNIPDRRPGKEPLIFEEAWKEDTLKEKVIVHNNHPEKPIVDYSSLSKVCAKDMYPLLEVEEELGSLMGYQYKCFLWIPKEHSQVRISETDEEKTSFHTEERVYCFTHMPKGLKNSAATLQRMMDNVLAE